MNAKCPYCEDGCAKCKDGYVKVTFSEAGHYHYMICNSCGIHTGGHLHLPNKVLPDKVSKYSVCPGCGSYDLRFSTCEESMYLA